MKNILSRLMAVTITAMSIIFISGCDSVNDDRIPYAEVYLNFPTVADWNIHGVKGDAAAYNIYIRQGNTRVPSNFPYTDLDRTGYGGLLLVNDVMGNSLAYDLSCPVEAQPTIRLHVPADQAFAECSTCGSTYEIYTNHGMPRSGPAADRGFALQRYSVTSGGALNYKIVTR
ncbi:MAG: hypothetical protein NC039_07345 [Muribaculaceae bacterium]|nr:hypothetical protein [Muribaculaceae bacterium]